MEMFGYRTKIAKYLALPKYIKSNRNASNDALDNIEAAVINTSTRAKAYIKFNGNLSGGIYPLWVKDKDGYPCDFDVDKMKN